MPKEHSDTPGFVHCGRCGIGTFLPLQQTYLWASVPLQEEEGL